MASLTRPDGAEIAWTGDGTGPLVVVAHQILWSYPGVYADLIAELSRDHRVVTYDARGCGGSSRQGPYDIETDTGDLAAVCEVAGGQAVALGVGYGYNLAVRVALAQPELVPAVLGVTPALATMLPREELNRAGVIGASDAVAEMLMTMLRTDPRAAMRSIVTITNPQLDEDGTRERVEYLSTYISDESALARGRVWLDDDPVEAARQLGARLWVQYGRAEVLFEGAFEERVAELYPQAHVEELEGGPVSRPDLVAERLRQITADQ
jgi:pimeloyl-ACP methyl ester carboxylesterase